MGWFLMNGFKRPAKADRPLLWGGKFRVVQMEDGHWQAQFLTAANWADASERWYFIPNQNTGNAERFDTERGARDLAQQAWEVTEAKRRARTIVKIVARVGD